MIATIQQAMSSAAMPKGPLALRVRIALMK
jgi:hypothetical protein